jgi:hypothetical protein
MPHTCRSQYPPGSAQFVESCHSFPGPCLAGVCQHPDLIADEVVKVKSVVGYASIASSKALASLRSDVSKPSVNQP